MSKRVFVSFAIEDEKYKNMLVGQAKNENSPFEFIDMSVKEPWSSEWKTKCRSKIKGCDGMIALLSKNTNSATWQKWEINCAKEEKIPVRGVYATTDNRPSSLPSELDGVRVINWTWPNIESFIDSLQ